MLQGPNGATQVITTDHLRSFTADPYTMARIAAVHSLGDIWAMGAAPQSALATIILPRMTTNMQRQWLAEIMDAATQVFGGVGADIVGGHSSIGAELTIGFSVTGLCQHKPITLSGAKPGDLIVLSKPIGTGTIMAGEMAMLASGAWVTQALRQMSTPQGDVAVALGHAHAMTDVTGFGLAGHLKNIAAASGVSITIDINAIQILPGALELAALGVRSSLFDDNADLAREIPTGISPRQDLLFDPQTAGGLLAAIAPQDFAAISSSINIQNNDLHIIGAVSKGPPMIVLKP